MLRDAMMVVGLCAGLAACSQEFQSAEVGPSGSRAVGQGGAKDIARFRSIVRDGEVPAPETLDEVGFFAEHAVDLPPANCGKSVCLHGMLAVAPRFDGGNWTMAFLAMNSPLDPASLPRPNAHVIVMIEEGQETPGYRGAIQSGIYALAAALRPEDRISVATYGTSVRWQVRGIEAANTSELDRAFARVWSVSPAGVSIYDALAAAGEVADEHRREGVPRILLLTAGRATAGVRSPDRIVALAESLAARGTSIGVIGYGEEFDDRLPLALGEIGAGTYAYAAHAADLSTLLRQEGETSLFPLARQFTAVVRAAPGYRIGRVYGASRAKVFEDRAELHVPALFLGHRTGASDVKQGRRGGGGGMFVELIAEPGAAERIGRHAPAFVVDARWVDAAAWEGVAERIEVTNVLAPGENPPSMWPFFSDPSRGKVFMMLNMYLALRTAVDFYAEGECGYSTGTVEMMEPSYRAWQLEHFDPDIEADWHLLESLDANVRKACTAEPIRPVSFKGGCMYI